MCECLQSRTCKGILLVLGIVFTVVGIVFDWMNFCEMKTNVDLFHDAKKDKPVNECKIQLQTYTWIYFAFILLKLVTSVIEIPVDIYRYINNTDPIVCCLRITFNEFIMLILKVIIGAFECVSLIMLLIVSSSCLRLEGKNVFPDISPDLVNDFLGGIFGLFGIVVSRILIKNVKRIKDVCIICWNACCNQQAPGEQEMAGVGGQAPGEQELAGVGGQAPGEQEMAGVCGQAPGEQKLTGVGCQAPGEQEMAGVGGQAPGEQELTGVGGQAPGEQEIEGVCGQAPGEQELAGVGGQAPREQEIAGVGRQAPGEQVIAGVRVQAPGDGVGQAPGEQEIADVETNCCNGFFLIIYIVLVIALIVLIILLIYAFCSVN